MTQLLPLAVSAEPLLRAIARHPRQPNTALASVSGRSEKNLPRDLKALEGAGLVTLKPTEITDAGRVQLQALDRAAGRGVALGPVIPAPAAIEGVVGLRHAQILPSSRNPRHDWDSEAAKESLAELAASIKAEGRLLQNLVVRPEKAAIAEHYHVFDGEGRELPVYELVAGERRWRAVADLIAAGDWPQDRPLPALITDVDDAGHDRIALIENLKRRDLKPLEEARAFKRLLDGGMKTVEIAEAIKMTQRLVQQRLQLLELGEADQARLERGEITIEGARTILANRPAPIELTDAQSLQLLELAWSIAQRGANLFTYTPIDYRTPRRFEDGGDLAWLEPYTYVGGDYSTGQTQLRFDYTARRLLLQLTGSEELSQSALRKPLREARMRGAPAYDPRCNPLSANYEALFAPVMVSDLERDGKFMSDFLNPPFMIDPEELKEIEDRKAEEIERKARRDKEQEEAKAEQARYAELRRAREANSGRVRQLAMAFGEVAKPDSGAVAEVLTAYGHPLPWRFRPGTEAEEGALIDANGEDVALDLYAEDDSLFALVMAAVNRAGGFDPVLLEPAPLPWAAKAKDEDEDDHARAAVDRPEFVGWIAGAFQEHFADWNAERCRAQAGHILDHFLKEETIDFGDAGYAWHRMAAVALADDFADGGEGDNDSAGDVDGEFEEA